jgi:hypothetical protein
VCLAFPFTKRITRGRLNKVGVTPVLFETDIQAQFLKPLLISLAFGLFFATLIVLFLLPAILVGLESIRARSAGRLARLPLVWQ